MVEINPPSIKQQKSKVKTFDCFTYHNQKKFNHHMIGDKKIICRNNFGDEKFFIVTRLTTKKIWSSYKIHN
jgi:hypothetical protein